MFFSETLFPENSTQDQGPSTRPDYSTRYKSRKNKHQRKKQKLVGELEKEYEDLLIFGYESKVFKDDEMAQKVNTGELLIPWRGETQNVILLDRYDVRNLLDDRGQFRKGVYTLTKTVEEIEEDRLCEEERWADLDSDAEDLYYLEEEEREPYIEEKRRQKQRAAEGNEISYDYSEGVEKQNECKEGDEEGPKDENQSATGEAYVAKFTVPEGMATEEEEEHHMNQGALICSILMISLIGSPYTFYRAVLMHPSDQRIDEIVERTARFLNTSNDAQMEIVIQAKQANNPSFSFLNKDDPLYPYYRHVRVQLRIGLFDYGGSDNEDEVAAAAVEGGEESEDKRKDAEVKSEGEAEDDGENENEDKKKTEEVTKDGNEVAEEEKPETSDENRTILDALDDYYLEFCATSETPWRSKSRGISKHIGPVVVPPLDVREIIDKTSMYVARCGPCLETKIREKHIYDSKFSFLLPWDQFYPYYKQKIEDERAITDAEWRQQKEEQQDTTKFKEWIDLSEQNGVHLQRGDNRKRLNVNAFPEQRDNNTLGRDRSVITICYDFSIGHHCASTGGAIPLVLLFSPASATEYDHRTVQNSEFARIPITCSYSSATITLTQRIHRLYQFKEIVGRCDGRPEEVDNCQDVGACIDMREERSLQEM
ncbi:3564_t:CDS:10 [Paraglomus brasilianum]|uniref:3564_t:CDS:1 n=1 Tax=Paraglomus brasilianum TaxID=144538 RepID=A0A9N9GTK1_9GLOM|nr:3564_t:CDS:10 [Paraglomus brasilianum]